MARRVRDKKRAKSHDAHKINPDSFTATHAGWGDSVGMETTNTTALLFSNLSAANAAYAAQVRKTQRAGTPANFAAMKSLKDEARKAYQTFWAQSDALDVARGAAKFSDARRVSNNSVLQA